MTQTTGAFIVAIVGISGTLVGIVIGHFLSRNWDRKKWLLDRRHEEFKELMTVIAAAFVTCGDPRYHLGEGNVEDFLAMNKASWNCLTTIQNRIYIAKQIKPLGLDRKWLDAFDSLVKTKDPELYGASVREILDSIVEAAEKHY
jgi:hypothetical protein